MQLSDLPDDLILEILSFCDASSILAIRKVRSLSGAEILTKLTVLRSSKTCIRFHVISYMRILWNDAFKFFCGIYPHLTPRLDRPLASHNRIDLETFVIKLFRLQKNWTRPEPPPTKTRVAFIPSNTRDVQALVTPGGRWLIIVCHQPLSMIYFDLDYLDRPGKFLLQSEDEDLNTRCFESSKCFARHNEDRMTFGLFLISYYHIPWRDPGYSEKGVLWDLEVEGLDHASARLKLSARWSADLPYHGINAIWTINEYGFSQFGPGYIDVFRWDTQERTCLSLSGEVSGSNRLCQFESPNSILILQIEKIWGLRLLSPDQIVVASADALELYTLPTSVPFAESTSSTTILPSEPLRRVVLVSNPECGATLVDPSPHHTHFPHWYRQTFGVVEPAVPGKHVAEYSHVSRFPIWGEAQLAFLSSGHYRCVKLGNYWGAFYAQLLSYHKDQTTGKWEAVEREIRLDDRWKEIVRHPFLFSGSQHFDEQMGRLVNLRRLGGKHEILVVDFA